MSNQFQLNCPGSCHCWVGIHWKEVKKKEKEKKSLWHGMACPMKHNEETGHRKMSRANCCSSSRLGCAKWLAKGYIASKEYQIMKLHLQISKLTCMPLCHCINSLSSLPHNFSTCSSHCIYSACIYLHLWQYFSKVINYY